MSTNSQPNRTLSNNLSKPLIVGYMSTNGAREYHGDLSQLKFLTRLPKGRLELDLNHKIEEAKKRTTDNNNEKITLLLKFILDHTGLNDFMAEYGFITYRRTLISVMCNAFGGAEPLSIMATLFDGAIYLCSLDTPSEIKRRQSRSKQEEKFCAWGYKFEQYLLSDLPSVQPDVQRPVIENEEFSLYYQATLGEHVLLYGAQIDGLLATDHPVADPSKTTDSETNLNYLRNNSFVELKTNREIEHYRQERNFKRHKLLRCWCQCYLADLKGLLVGFRNDEGIVHRLQWFSTEQIVTYCKNEWDPQTALNYLDSVLSFIKNCFKSHVVKVYGNNCNVKNVGPINLQFDFDVNKTIKVTHCDENIDPILPNWFVENKRIYSNTPLYAKDTFQRKSR